jgi:hypothetical protein
MCGFWLRVWFLSCHSRSVGYCVLFPFLLFVSSLNHVQNDVKLAEVKFIEKVFEVFRFVLAELPPLQGYGVGFVG